MPFRNIPFVSFGQALAGTAQAYGKERDFLEKQKQVQRQNEMQDKVMQRDERRFQTEQERFGQQMDFNREKYGFDKSLREKDLELKEMQLGLKRMELEGKGMSGPFKGNGWIPQQANAYYRSLREKGMDHVQAERNSIDRVRELEGSLVKITDEVTGKVDYMQQPGRPLFKNSAPRTYQGGPWRAGDSGRSAQQQGQSGQQGSGFNPRPQFEGERAEPIRPIQTTLEAVDAATGYRGALGGLVNVASGLSSGLLPDDVAQTQARRNLEMAQLQIRSFIEATKPNVTEIKMLQDKIEALKPGILKTPEKMRTELKSLDDYLMYIRSSAEKDFQQSNYIDIATRRSLGARITEIDRLRGYLFGVGEGEPAVFDIEQKSRPARGRSSSADDALNAEVEAMLREAGLD